jgi:hypothetical protein
MEMAYNHALSVYTHSYFSKSSSVIIKNPDMAKNKKQGPRPWGAPVIGSRLGGNQLISVIIHPIIILGDCPHQ